MLKNNFPLLLVFVSLFLGCNTQNTEIFVTYTHSGFIVKNKNFNNIDDLITYLNTQENKSVTIQSERKMTTEEYYQNIYKSLHDANIVVSEFWVPVSTNATGISPIGTASIIDRLRETDLKKQILLRPVCY